MQRYSLRHVSRAVVAGILIAGLAAGAGCQKKSDSDSGGASSDTSATGGMSAAPGSGAAGSSGDSGASMPGAASAPGGASGG
ncbi:hypothetical protein BLA18112_04078 [Burkholderia lata]|uniref:Lipoprotein n=1 Tax=Burkholderia lata (strain ATCC 17760 / DSM 23089 / LMG 22485 / NCIMB 9086 / R18194 / 383) TaxID=482957 RepID=A0A6P2WYU7_BURL3|nr:hypothetical protein [Burkholderia lata]VWD02291.1 hypothetical protein BLA18112_04078 [Burkholderia lata]